MMTMQLIDWKNEWFPIEDATYLNFAAHAAIPRVAHKAVQASVAAKGRPHIVGDQSFFSSLASQLDGTVPPKWQTRNQFAYARTV
jgi:hypothetical protein